MNDVQSAGGENNFSQSINTNIHGCIFMYLLLLLTEIGDIICTKIIYPHTSSTTYKNKSCMYWKIRLFAF